MLDDKAAETQKKRIRTLIQKWIKPLLLGGWSIEFQYDRGSLETYPDGYSTLMTCKTRWPYLQSLIKISLFQIEDLDDDVLETHFVHELMHIFLSEMREKGLDHEERVATWLGRAFETVRNAGRREGAQDARSRGLRAGAAQPAKTGEQRPGEAGGDPDVPGRSGVEIQDPAAGAGRERVVRATYDVPAGASNGTAVKCVRLDPHEHAGGLFGLHDHRWLRPAAGDDSISGRDPGHDRGTGDDPAAGPDTVAPGCATIGAGPGPAGGAA